MALGTPNIPPGFHPYPIKVTQQEALVYTNQGFL